MLRKVKNWAKKVIKKNQYKEKNQDLQSPTLETDCKTINSSFSEWYEKSKFSSWLYIDLSSTCTEFLKENYPELVSHTITQANKIVRHQFNLLGSGNYVPSDLERSLDLDSYQAIDWYLDPISNLRFPQGIPHQQWDLFIMRPGNADIKLPWELARCQHWITLGQAYRLTEDECYAKEIANQLSDFMSANPVGIGINWTCTMDVALRALNWSLALVLIKNSAQLSIDFWQEAYTALFNHGIFIFNNLENTYEVTSNHFLSNVVGLYYLAKVFRDLPQGQVWEKFCRSSLEEEMQVQVLDDGADYESSIPYHRLVTELFLGAARLADFHQEPLSDAYLKRLSQMINFVAAVMRPDGLMPQVGDADDGRLHIFTRYGSWQPQDARHLFAPAALLLNQSRWLSYGGIEGIWEAAWWGFDVFQVEIEEALSFSICHQFPEAGLTVFRKGSNYLLITNGVVGTKGFGNHKHNDQLGFECHLAGIPLLVDPGSYVYTSDFEARNLFRSTGYHNTLRIDEEEQNEIRPEWLFRLFETAYAKSLVSLCNEDYGEYRGQHIGYQRLKSPVTHERRFRFDARQGILFILDRLEGKGSHLLEWHFHFAPGVIVTTQGEGTYKISAQNQHFIFSTPKTLEGEVKEAWYSPSYGVKNACQSLDVTLRAELNRINHWFFALVPESCYVQSEWQDKLSQSYQIMIS
jgi:hypothetical protein